jgi:hypothetical protein
MPRKARLTGSAALVAVLAAAGPGPAFAGTQDRLKQLEERMLEMQREIERLRSEQAETAEKAEAARRDAEETRKSSVITTGKSPGSFRLPGSETDVTIGGYVKGDFIFDTSESVGDLFVTESLSVSDDDDEERFRAHARQSRLFFKTSTPTDWGPLTTHIQGDFFGGGGNENFSNSTTFRIRHATATFGDAADFGQVRAGQFWTNFMPIESYPATLDFQGPAGMPFIRQAQLRYTKAVSENLSISGSLENSEFSGRDASGFITESSTVGIRAGLDKAPDFTAAATWRDDWGLVKLAGVGRYLGSPNSAGDGEVGWGLNLSGNAALWPGGKIVGSFTYGEGVGRYIINGFGQDAFVEADGDVEAIEAWGVAGQISQALTDEITVAAAFGRTEIEDSFAPTDLDNTNSVHASLFWRPIDRLMIGGEVIWGNRENADGQSDSNVRLQSSVQVSF